MKIVIPAYEPDVRVIELVKQLSENGISQILVVDDGSGAAYHHIFNELEQLGCEVITHERNYGKGTALKSAFQQLIAQNYNGVIVCADSDGQHKPKDIITAGAHIYGKENTIVLGCRHFVGEVPLRSRLGNELTKKVYRFATGISVSDTQTGLRAYSSQLLPWLCSILGDRFQYEMNMLLTAHEDKINIEEIMIETVYIKGNESSHFRPIRDSIEVYVPFFRFGASSFCSFLIDFLLVLFLNWISDDLLFSVIGARIFSSLFNYILNLKIVFRKTNNEVATLRHSLPRYYFLATILLALNYALLYGLTEGIQVSLIISKLFTEVLLFVGSYWIQRRFVFLR
ncbi:bifunctional glycosyltransferase family 2/GtrA family protein [Paenibacillus endoradicis]|uniref:bifunctional glycosyltransferase family 2/GtrA family protein n=1 Tax=Paenibacillus endoradicis TaxID=2972487 RepID=UPI00215989B0|nr:bifunctional glycosyltransferase family 2/GtrA family protein [Paenibacillus endoradicis]MCR8660378.1 bifunctional glycosyltransferase family 2/GtrA family protein [Paenibacillus endoradicis]